MEATRVIRRPLVTEKSTEGSEHHRYAFEVDAAATKLDIRKAVEALYKVRVISVNTLNRRGKVRRNKFGWFVRGDMKRAFVRIHPEDRIELF